MSEVRWLAEHAAHGEVSFRIGRDGDDLIAEWIGLVRLVARRDGTASRLEIVAGADVRAVEKIERGSARLLLRHLEGRVALHGAAVVSGDRAVVLLGRSGDGKSTLAAWLCARAGATLFADDAVAIDEVFRDPHSTDGVENRWVVLAAERDHWLDDAAQRAIGLCPRAARDGTGSVGKIPVRSEHAGSGRARLHALVALAFTDVAAPRLTRLHGVEALAALVPQAVRFVLDEPALQRRELDELGALVETVPVFRLERARDLAQLDETGLLVEDVFFRETKDILP